jgi:hypothetical protein
MMRSRSRRAQRMGIIEDPPCWETMTEIDINKRPYNWSSSGMTLDSTHRIMHCCISRPEITLPEAEQSIASAKGCVSVHHAMFLRRSERIPRVLSPAPTVESLLAESGRCMGPDVSGATFVAIPGKWSCPHTRGRESWQQQQQACDTLSVHSSLIDIVSISLKVELFRWSLCSK